MTKKSIEIYVFCRQLGVDFVREKKSCEKEREGDVEGEVERKQRK
jgi:hypothetical protein